MKQTSIDWLAEQLRQKLTIEINIHGQDSVLYGMMKMVEYMEQQLPTARKMHREEVEGAVSVGRNTHIKAKDYYTQTFETP